MLCPRVTQSGIQIEDRKVCDLPELLYEGDLLILNDTKVVPCRFIFPGSLLGGEAECELFLSFLVSEQKSESVYSALVRPKRLFKPGKRFALSSELEAEILGDGSDGQVLVRVVKTGSSALTIQQIVEQEGGVPIPPYIREGRSSTEDRDLYQTVYATTPGSVAAPTAGLHFTSELLSRIEAKGVIIRYLTLHVGLPSILPSERNVVSGEQYRVPADLASEIERTKQRKHKVIAVGTTVTRALESYALTNKTDEWLETRLFIAPGFEFKIVDRLMTNFHQPGSTHLSLVSAFATVAVIASAYSYALDHDYRFLSYGDSMLLDRL